MSDVMTKAEIQELVNQSLSSAMNHLMTDKVSLVTLATNMFSTLSNTLIEYVQNQNEYNKTMKVFRKYEPGCWRVHLDTDHNLQIWCQDTAELAQVSLQTAEEQVAVQWHPVPLPTTEAALSGLIVMLIHQGVPYDQDIYVMSREMAIDHMVAAKQWIDERADYVRGQMQSMAASDVASTDE